MNNFMGNIRNSNEKKTRFTAETKIKRKQSYRHRRIGLRHPKTFILCVQYVNTRYVHFSLPLAVECTRSDLSWTVVQCMNADVVPNFCSSFLIITIRPSSSQNSANEFKTWSNLIRSSSSTKIICNCF